MSKKISKTHTDVQTRDTTSAVEPEEREQIARVQEALRRPIPPGLPYGEELGWPRNEKRRKEIEEGLKELIQLLADVLNPAEPLVAEMCAIVEEPPPSYVVEDAHVTFKAVRSYHPSGVRGYNEIEEAAFDVPDGHTLIRCRLTNKYFTLPTDGLYPVIEHVGRILPDAEVWDWTLPIHPDLLNKPPEVLQAALLHQARERIGYALQYLRDAADFAQIATLHGEDGLRCGGWPAQAFQTEHYEWVKRDGEPELVKKRQRTGWQDVKPRKVA